MHFNKRLHRIQNQLDTDLSQKYQISENIKVVKAIVPVSLACGFMNLLTSITSATISRSYLNNYREIIFNLMMNLNVFIALLLILKSSVVKHKITSMVPWLKKLFGENKLIKFNIDMIGLSAEKGQNQHFDNLKKMWK